MTRTCPVHGETEELCYGNYQMYLKFSSYWSDGKGAKAPNVVMENCQCPANCGFQQPSEPHGPLGRGLTAVRDGPPELPGLS